jgi:hypothetical protein
MSILRKREVMIQPQMALVSFKRDVEEEIQFVPSLASGVVAYNLVSEARPFC